MTPEAEAFVEQFVRVAIGDTENPQLGLLEYMGYGEKTMVFPNYQSYGAFPGGPPADSTTLPSLSGALMVKMREAGVESVEDAMRWVQEQFGSSYATNMNIARAAIDSNNGPAWEALGLTPGEFPIDPIHGRNLTDASARIFIPDGLTPGSGEWIDLPAGTITQVGKFDATPIVTPDFTMAQRQEYLPGLPIDQPYQVVMTLPEEGDRGEMSFKAFAFIAATDMTVGETRALETAAGVPVEQQRFPAGTSGDVQFGPGNQASETNDAVTPSEPYTGAVDPESGAAGVPLAEGITLSGNDTTEGRLREEANFITDPVHGEFGYLGFSDRPDIVGVKVPVDEDGNRVYPGSGRTAVGKADIMFKWQPGDAEMMFASWSRENIAWLQSELVARGILTESQFQDGRWDAATESAVTQVMAFGQVEGYIGQGARIPELSDQRDSGSLPPLPPTGEGTDLADFFTAADMMGKGMEELPLVPAFVKPKRRNPDPATIRAVIEDEFQQRVGRKPNAGEIQGYMRYLNDQYRIAYDVQQLRAEQQWIEEHLATGEYLASKEQRDVLEDQGVGSVWKDELEPVDVEVDPVSRFREFFERNERKGMERVDAQATKQTMRDSILGSAFVARGRGN